MTDYPETAPASHEQPLWLSATAQDFLVVDLNQPIAQTSSVSAYTLSRMFGEAGRVLEGSQRGPEQRVYAMLGAVCSFHFRSENRDDPFGPMARFSDRRTAVPEDFRGTPVEVLANNIERIENPGVRARVADMVWLLERKRVAAGWLAVEGYWKMVTGVKDGRWTFRAEGAGVHDFEVAEHLRRGIQIARVLGWDDEKSIALRELVNSLRLEALAQKFASSFRRLATLDLDYRVSNATAIADEAELLADASSDQHLRYDLLHIAARARRAGKEQPAAERLLLQAAECLVAISQIEPGSGMFEVHWLERAIGEMQNVPGTKDRRRELKHRLVDAQSHIIDEMSQFSHSEDISAEAAAAQNTVAGKPLMLALRALSRLSHAPAPAELEADARKLIAENPLASMFAATQYDAQGKPVHRDGGLESGDDEAVVRRQVAQMERFRRSTVVQARIEPARLKIAEEHYIGSDVIDILCSQSPFVPQDRRAIFANGLLAFLREDMISALHTLMPQLENSLRHVLRQLGHDVTRLTEDMNQEDLSLSALIERLGHALMAIFGNRMVSDIDNVFNYRGGPNLRNRVAHGLVGQWEPQSDDSIYACWLIFQLCCIPLRGRWDELARLFSTAEGAGELEAQNMSKVLRLPLIRLTASRPGRIGPLPLGRRTTGLGAPRAARPTGTSQLAPSSVIKSGEYRVKALKSLAAALKEIEPFVRDPRLLRTGRELRNFERMKPRELVGNVLLALAANPITAMEWIRISTDPFNADGLIINEATHEAWLMEHVFAYVHDGPAVDVTNLLLERIAKKLGKGDGYCQGKTLCVLLDHTGQWVPDDVVKKLPMPRTLRSIMVANRIGRTALGEFVYHIVRLDWVLGYAPRWRVTITPDFTSWRVDREQ